MIAAESDENVRRALRDLEDAKCDSFLMQKRRFVMSRFHAVFTALIAGLVLAESRRGSDRSWQIVLLVGIVGWALSYVARTYAQYKHQVSLILLGVEAGDYRAELRCVLERLGLKSSSQQEAIASAILLEGLDREGAIERFWSIKVLECAKADQELPNRIA